MECLGLLATGSMRIRSGKLLADITGLGCECKGTLNDNREGGVLREML